MPCYPKISLVVSRITECNEGKKQAPNNVERERGCTENLLSDPILGINDETKIQEGGFKEHTYCKRGEGHTHAPKAIESQGNEDKDREFCKRHIC